jgi:Spy/CpxP family protein refolding chaperone
VALLLAITFMAGMAAGVAADRQLRVNAEAEAAEAPTGDSVAVSHENGDRPRGRGATIERFADDLGLTEDQRAEIAPIIEDARRQMSELFGSVRPAYGEIVDSAKARIEVILTPEQVTEYRRLLESEYGGRDGRRNGRGPRDGRGRDDAVRDDDGAEGNE